LETLAAKYRRGKDWIRKQLQEAPVRRTCSIPQPVVIIADVTFFGRDAALCVIREAHLKKTLCVREVSTESVEVYRQGRETIERQGYVIQAVVLDGRPGVRQLFSDVPVQMCHFHQKQIITRY
jgi:hypothetical protein